MVFIHIRDPDEYEAEQSQFVFFLDCTASNNTYKLAFVNIHQERGARKPK